MLKQPFLFLLFITTGCGRMDHKPEAVPEKLSDPIWYKTIGHIPLPDGYKRLAVPPGSFGEWLRSVSLKKDKRVYLYNGTLKQNQSVQFAVLDISVGNKDLQQCADAVMRLRAEYLFAQKNYHSIEFRDNNNKAYKWEGGDNRVRFDQYLETVFGYCGSASLEKQLIPVKQRKQLQPGDVFIHGGYPGHAMIVVDAAINNKRQKIFMLAQSYMPAQDIHIVINPVEPGLSPWYEVNEANAITTPQWTFYKNQLRSW